MALLTNEEKKQRVRQRVRVRMEEGTYETFPETVRTDTYKSDEYQRVAIYARVSTDDVSQTTSFELQKKYYEDFVARHPKWELVEIYADEGISGTSTKHRDAFNRMMADAKDGKIDLIITKSVSRFARNVENFLTAVRTLSEHKPRIGVFFESENIYSLKEDSQMALSFQATMAEEESRNKSRSMETSLRMRLDHGLPLTPCLLGFRHDDDGKLVPDPESFRIPKLMFWMVLYGYSTAQIAEKLTRLGKKTYKGNTAWTATGVLSTLRNERYCGDVFTRKTFTPDVVSHRSVKNRGERARTRYLDEHEAIVSREDFVAVQHILNNTRYRNRNLLPELRVVPEGLLKGFVVVNTRWSGFREADYLRASAEVTGAGAVAEVTGAGAVAEPAVYEAEEGDFDLRGFEIAPLDLLEPRLSPCVKIQDGTLRFSMECIRRLGCESVELLLHPGERKLAVRRSVRENRNAVVWSRQDNGRLAAKDVQCAAFSETLFSIFDWNRHYRYRLYGTHYHDGAEDAFVFSARDASAYICDADLELPEGTKAFTRSGKYVGALPAAFAGAIGKDFYAEQSALALSRMTKEEWQIRLEGQLCASGKQFNVTSYDEIRAFIQGELGDLFWEDDVDDV